jgi:hypothetical protein
MDFTNLGNVRQAINAAGQKGAELQQSYDTQAAQRAGEYQTAQQEATRAQQAYKDFQPQSGQDLYRQNLGFYEQRYGLDPTALQKANQNLLRTQVAMEYAPQSARQMGNYYGQTAGQSQQAYNNIAENLNQTLGNQQAAVNSYVNLIAATQGAAKDTAAAEIQTQGQKIEQLKGVASNANQIMATAASALAEIEKLQQNQGYLTAQQQAAYQNSYNDYVKAQAAATSANAAIISANAAARTANESIKQYDAIKGAFTRIYGDNFAAAIQYIMNGMTPPDELKIQGSNTNQMTKQTVNTMRGPLTYFAGTY